MASARLAAMTLQFASVATREQRGTFEMKNLTKETRQARNELTMKVFIMLVTLSFAILLVSGTSRIINDVSAQDGKKPPDKIILAIEAKLGPVAFNHTDHINKNRSADGTAKIACVECHHTAQPAAEALKHPPHKTVWPADRTATLTADLFEKDPNAPPVNDCRDCHARAETKPKLLPEIPQLKMEGADPIILNNQQAFHRTCGACHDAVLKVRPDATAVGSKKCTACHKRAA
jgi:cytochrome c553